LRSATLDNKRSQHNAPLPPELAVRTTAKQWERYRLSQYTTALEQPRKLLVEAPQGVTPPAAVVALERKSNLTGDERADFYRRAFGKPPENLRLGMSPSVPQRRTPASPRLRVSKDELRKQAGAALATEHPITVCPTYYGYDPMKRRRGRPRKPKLRLIRSNGRPRLGTEALPAAVRAQRYRDKKKALRLVAGVTRVHFTPRLQAWMWAHLNAETLALCNMRKAA
jgi:hypothetical protein